MSFQTYKAAPSNKLADEVFDLAMMTRAVAAGFASREDLNDEDTRNGFQRLALRIADALVDMNQVVGDRLKAGSAIAFSSEPVPAPMPALPAGDEPFRMVLLGYFLGQRGAANSTDLLRHLRTIQRPGAGRTDDFQKGYLEALFDSANVAAIMGERGHISSSAAPSLVEGEADSLMTDHQWLSTLLQAIRDTKAVPDREKWSRADPARYAA